MRIVIALGLVRALTAKSTPHGGRFGFWTRIDTAFVLCTLIQALAIVLTYQQWGAATNQIAFIWDCIGGYLLLRFLIQTEADVYRAIKCMAVIAFLLATAMLIEQVKLVNYFSMLGDGIPLVPELRDGRIRSQGPFLHSLLAGTVGAMLFPMFIVLWKTGKGRIWALAGALGATVMTITSSSSTPLLTYVAGVVGICAWPIRRKMRNVRWGIVGALVVLAFVMKAPVWFVISHFEVTGGSSGYHRAMLVDQFIRHFTDWWLIGTKETGNWGWDMWDVQNQYVNVGYAGGLAGFVCFLAVISWSFARIGKARRAAQSKMIEWALWCLGASLFANVVAFFGINYFDQSRMAWFAVLAMISAYSSSVLKARKLAQPKAEPAQPSKEFAYPSLGSPASVSSQLFSRSELS